MKRFTFTLAFAVAGISAIHAQNFTNTGSGLNKIDTKDEQQASGPARPEPAAKVVYADPYSMEYITMENQEQTLSFENLPNISMTMHITDANGNEVMTKRLSKKNHTANIKNLKKGIHFVTLMSDNTGNRKAFTLNRN